MTTLILARHGHSTYNAKGLYTGQADPALDERGAQEATQMATLLADTAINAIYASDLTRAVETARPTAERHELPIRTSAALREIDMGAWTGLPYAEVQASSPEALARFCTDVNAPCPGGESLAAACARIIAALTRILETHEGETVLVVSHALTCRLIAALAEGKEASRAMESPVPPNATPITYRFEKGEFLPS